MHLSLASDAVFQYRSAHPDPKELLAAFRETGFRYMDFDITFDMLGDDLEEQADRWAELLRECDIQVTQSHAVCANPFGVTKNGEMISEYMIRSLYFCQRAGFPSTVVHPGSVEGNTGEAFLEKNLAFYRSLIPHMEKTGVGVQIENIGHYMDPYFLWNGKDLRDLIGQLDHPMFTACWDIGHANHFEYMHGGDPYASIMALGDKLTAIHAHENVGFFPDPNKRKRVDMHMMPYASGKSSVNWDAVLQALKDVGYKGTFNFESVTPARSSFRPEFVYNGKVVRTLEMPPLRIWKMITAALYEIGKFMLESYGMYEE